MLQALRSELGRVLLLLLVLLGFKIGHLTGWPRVAGDPGLDRLASTLSNRGLNKEAREAMTAGYYEGLLNEGSRLSTMNRFVLDTRRPKWEDNQRPESRQTGNFLYFEHVPNRTTPDYADDRFRYMLTTNSAGLGDKEYPLAKPAGSRRIALLGDSITRGLGAPPGGNYESLLEQELNEANVSNQVRQYEILNFAVSGYHITQQMESARVKAAAFEPDVYLIALSDLSVYRRWHGHISALMYAGIDLKYEFLRDIVSESRLSADDPIGIFDARLARYRLPAIRWVLGEIQAHAAAHGATTMAILVPSTESPEVLAEAFLGVPEILAELQIPAINLLDAFAAPARLDDYKISEGDRHPNAAGHRALFHLLYSRLQQDPALMQVFSGSAPP